MRTAGVTRLELPRQRVAFDEVGQVWQPLSPHAKVASVGPRKWSCAMGYRLREVIKGVCLLVVAVSPFGVMFTWGEPGQQAWTIGWAATFVLAIVGFVFVDRRKPSVPEYLFREFRGFVDCEGFCFVIRTAVIDSVCYFKVHFQNRYARACAARILLHPSDRAFRADKDLALTFAIDSPGGARGVSQFPVPVSGLIAGRTVQFDLTAGVVP